MHKLKTVAVDRREQQRLPFRMEECKGTLTLQTGDEQYGIGDVRDSTPTEIGVEILSIVELDMPIAIVYREDKKAVLPGAESPVKSR